MSKGHPIKAASAGDYRVKSGVSIALVSTAAVVGVYLAVYNCVAGSMLFAAAYAVAVILAADYAVMKANTVFATYISAEDGYLYIKNWNNDFFPYAANGRIKALREFIPARTRIFEVPVDEISDVAIGTKNYIKRLFPEDEGFKRRIARYEQNGGSGQKRFLKTADIFYVRTIDGKSLVSGISRYDEDALARIVKYIKREYPAANVMLNSREFRTLRMRGK